MSLTAFSIVRCYHHYKYSWLVYMVEISSIQQHTNSVDCGLFAIALIVQFCIGYYVEKQLIKFDEDYLREHLVSRLENGPFSTSGEKAKLNKKKTAYKDVQCDCSKYNLPNLMQEMIGWEAGKNICDLWRHIDYADVGTDSDFNCTPQRRTPNPVSVTYCKYFVEKKNTIFFSRYCLLWPYKRIFWK